MKGIFRSLRGSDILTIGCEKSIRVENYADTIFGYTAPRLINVTNIYPAVDVHA